MKIFYSANGLFSSKGLEKYYPKPIDMLISYYGLNKIERPRFCRDLFLDSGAFSAYRQQVSIDVARYAEFILKNVSDLFVYANLDVIGDPETSWSNQLFLERFGLHPIPTFHYGEAEKWLDLYLDRYDYIALGGMGDKVDTLRWSFLDKAFSIVQRRSMMPRVHGFGIQDERLLKAFPWFSVDATSVHMQARYGGIRTPWGWLKINPEVNFQETKWHTPLQIEAVKEWVDSLGLPLDFTEARQRTPEGTLGRCAISLAYFDKEFGDGYEFSPLQKAETFYGFGI